MKKSFKRNTESRLIYRSASNLFLGMVHPEKSKIRYACRISLKKTPKSPQQQSWKTNHYLFLDEI